jgi:RNA recognition motif-containing protein
MWTEAAPTLPTVSPLAGMGGGIQLGTSPMRSENVGSDMGEEELIPTAIVIKNIPFAVKKEQLVQLMTEINLPLPYAFNYHFDNGVFRGLAFANFTTAEETAAVIEILNGFELQGRKLRVEYKKMLPIQERERIEREKRERRGQLEEQHRPIQAPPLATSPSPSINRGKPGELITTPPNSLACPNCANRCRCGFERSSDASVLLPATPIPRRPFARGLDLPTYPLPATTTNRTYPCPPYGIVACLSRKW